MATLDLIKERYPQVYAIYKSKPEILYIYATAIDQGWPQERIDQAVRDSKYFKSTSDSQRAWDVLNATNPGEANRRVNDALNSATQAANRLGLYATPQELKAFASFASANGWTQDDAYNVLVVATMKKHTDANGKLNLNGLGEIGASMTAVRQIAADYAVPLSDEEAMRFGGDLLQKKQTKDSIVNQMKFRAQGLYPSLKSQLDAGVTVAQFAQPYKQLAAQELEVSPDAMPLSDDKWRKMMQTTDPDTREVRPMTLSEWQATVRTDPSYGFDKTTGARKTAADFAGNLMTAFGAKG